jgi:hypothetical protein
VADDAWEDLVERTVDGDVTPGAVLGDGLERDPVVAEARAWTASRG